MQPSDDTLHEAIEAGKRHYKLLCNLAYGHSHPVVTEAVCIARAVWAEAQRAAVPQWVACSERLPERNVEVLVYCSDTREQFVAFLRADGYFQYAMDPRGDGEICCEPTHWQPTPNPPKEPTP